MYSRLRKFHYNKGVETHKLGTALQTAFSASLELQLSLSFGYFWCTVPARKSNDMKRRLAGTFVGGREIPIREIFQLMVTIKTSKNHVVSH